MKRRTTAVAVLLVFLLSAVGLAGCAPKATPTPTPGVAAPAPAATPTPAPKAITLVAQTIHPANTLMQELNLYFGELVGKASGGRLKIETHFGGELVGMLETADAVKAGSLDIALGFPQVWFAGKEPALNFAGTFPFSLDPHQLWLWYDGWGGMERAQKVWDRHGIKILAVGTFGAETLNSRKEVRTLDDFKGLKIRSAGIAAAFFKGLGASAITVAGADMYSALERGLIDAYEYGGPGLNNLMGFDPLTKYYIMPSWHGLNNDQALLINKAKFDPLPADLQGILKASAEAWALRYSLGMEAFDAKVLEKNVATGAIKVIVLPEADVAKARELAMKLMEEFADKSPEAREWWESVKAFRKAYEPQAIQYKGVRP